MSVVNVGIIGCGNISNVYFEAANKFEIFDIVACADLIPERAEAKAAEFNNIEPRSVEAIMEDPAIEIIVNLTIPGAHADIASSALLNGKSVYTEKPMAI